MHLDIFCCGVRVVSFPLGKDRVHQGHCINCRSYGPVVAAIASVDTCGSAIRQQLILFRDFPHSGRTEVIPRAQGAAPGNARDTSQVVALGHCFLPS
jgi:hypothetical protein